MKGVHRAVSGQYSEVLATGWEFCTVRPGAVDSPAALPAAGVTWTPTRVPNTLAGSLRDAGLWSLSSPPRRFDGEEVWYRCRFMRPAAESGEWVLCFDGLATLADVWLNGEPLFASDNMFLAHEARLTALADENELAIRFRSLDVALGAKRPRPRWRVPMIENQQLRWLRTTLLGRTPGWSPPAAAVGPWREIRLERRLLDLSSMSLRAELVGNSGAVEFLASVSIVGGEPVSRGKLVLERAGRQHVGPVEFDGASQRISSTLSIAHVEPWWPHTHGTPAIYSAWLELETGGRPVRIDLPPVGFRRIEIDTSDGGFALRVNGEKVFCRGACWTPIDAVTLDASREETARLLTQARDAGMNMIRVGGTMVYENDAFYDLADELGILVWQDLMFANMDYPEDPDFIDNVSRELTQQMNRLLPHASVAVVCGNSEGEQQAAMWGATRERWNPRLFHEFVPALLDTLRSRAAYWPSSAHGGSFPHQVDRGTTSYYGVGAYLRPLEDARRSEVRFATECLGVANVPEESTLAAMPNGLSIRVHHPEWKLRAPRDLGAGWDFDDVRDTYLRMLFGVDPLALRYADHDRYLKLSRIVSGEMMAAAFSEWRRARSTCQGALVWFMRDFWEGAGWGIIDSLGVPKSPYHALKRVLQPAFVGISDEGNSGLALHVANESRAALQGTLSLTLYRGGEIVVARGQRTLEVPARGAIELNAAELFEGFHDLSHAYRFGPPAYDVAVASWSRTGAEPIFAAFFPGGRAANRSADPGLRAEARAVDGGYLLTLRARAFARWVSVHADGFVADDQYFHLTPGSERALMLRPAPRVTPRVLRGTVDAVNSAAAVPIELRA